MALVVFITMAVMGALGTVDVYHDTLTQLVTHAVITNNTPHTVRLTIDQGIVTNTWEVASGDSQTVDLTALLLATLIDLDTEDVRLEAGANIAFGCCFDPPP